MRHLLVGVPGRADAEVAPRLRPPLPPPLRRHVARLPQDVPLLQGQRLALQEVMILEDGGGDLFMKHFNIESNVMLDYVPFKRGEK